MVCTGLRKGSRALDKPLVSYKTANQDSRGMNVAVQEISIFQTATQKGKNPHKTKAYLKLYFQFKS